MINVFDEQVKTLLGERLHALEKHFGGDVIFLYGSIGPGFGRLFRDFIEDLRQPLESELEPISTQKRLIVFLNTPGGMAEIVEKLVEIIRFHYAEVFFVVPDYAMSAGTILCMSGDKIYMDYSSSLGPIDPQIYNGKNWVPALGYLDQVERMLGKDRLTNAELIMLQNLDLAELSQYEQAKNLTITLLKDWLVEYKFKDWLAHKSGQEVTKQEKDKRAEEIAKLLADNTTWHSHGRMIGISTLRNVLRLRIEDYSNDTELRALIRAYNDFLVQYINRHNISQFLHSRKYF